MRKCSGSSGCWLSNPSPRLSVIPFQSTSNNPLNHSRSGSRRTGNFVLGGFQGSDLIGTAGFYREPRAKHHHTGVIWGVFVAPAHRGQKVGRALVEAVIERARTLPGVEKIQLTVSVTQSQARKLYAGLGFRIYGVEPQAICVEGRYFDEDRMFLDLAQRC